MIRPLKKNRCRGQEEAAVGRSLVSVTPDPGLDLGKDVNLEPEFLVVGLELETWAEVGLQGDLLGVRDVRDSVPWFGWAGLDLEAVVVRHRRAWLGRLVAAPGCFILLPLARPTRQLLDSLENLFHLLVMLSPGPH